jgi:tryptophanyl-tRNA synthetase
MKRVFSGVQPTGNLHLGNYLGAIKNFVAMQNSFDCIYCVVDMHAITVWQNPDDLRKSVRSVAAAFIASGVDPEKSIIFNQSRVSVHAELAWVLNCVARIGWLNRMTQFKEKAGKNREGASIGLYAYPVLMAADILGYKATHVPVGDDQKQHLELARDIAIKFNQDYECDIFRLPEPVFMQGITRVMSLRDGLAKMSKSDPSDMSRIHLSDSNDEIEKKIKKAKTDLFNLPINKDGLNDRPEAANLLGIYAALTDKTLENSINHFADKSFADFKKEFIEVTINHISPIREKMQQLLVDTSYIDDILQKGAVKANEIANNTFEEVCNRIGFIR